MLASRGVQQAVEYLPSCLGDETELLPVSQGMDRKEIYRTVRVAVKMSIIQIHSKIPQQIQHLTRFCMPDGQGPLTSTLLHCRSQDLSILEGRVQAAAQDPRPALNAAQLGLPSGGKALKVGRSCTSCTCRILLSRSTHCVTPCPAGLA